MLTIIGGDHVAKEGLRRCHVNLRRELGVVESGEGRIVQTLGWRVRA